MRRLLRPVKDFQYGLPVPTPIMPTTFCSRARALDRYNMPTCPPIECVSSATGCPADRPSTSLAALMVSG